MGSIWCDLEVDADDADVDHKQLHPVIYNYSPLPATTKETVKTLNVKIKDDQLIQAYIHQINILLSDKYIIPTSICDLCYLFYHIPSDHFESFGYKINAMNEDQTEIKNVSYFDGHLSGYINSYRFAYNTAYGTEIIAPRLHQIYRWKFKIIDDYCIGSIYIGIDTLNADFEYTNFSGNKDTKNYAYCSNGKKYSHGLDEIFGEYYSETYSKGDVIIMTLDFSSETGVLSFRVKQKNKMMKIAFDDIPSTHKYKSAVALFSECEVKLLKYTEKKRL